VSWLRHALLEDAGIAHGFGTRASRPPAGLLRPKQVHGARVIRLSKVSGPVAAEGEVLGEADAIVSDAPGRPVGVVTADCVPILVATPSGCVAAVHAGWRGLAAGVIGAALEALADLAPDAHAAFAAIGPHVGRACYEVDAPVVDALAPRFGAALDVALGSTRPGHWQLDLGALVRRELERAGVAAARIGALDGACTACDRERFHSFRRDGPNAGRLFHFAVARGPVARPGGDGIASRS
jgi:polyphenol oxidase